MLAQKFDVFLGGGSGLVNGFAALSGTLEKFFGLALDFGVKALKYREHRTLEGLCGLGVGIGYALEYF